jgi:hypothetical protein
VARPLPLAGKDVIILPGPFIRILTAVAPDTVERVRRILAGHELLIAHNIDAAKAILGNEEVGLVFVGARFDESRMFELLEFIRQHVEHRKIPIVAGIIIPTTMSDDTIKGLGHASKIYGASVFVNLNDFPDDDVGNQRVRLIVDAVIAPPEVIPKVQDILGGKAP